MNGHRGALPCPKRAAASAVALVLVVATVHGCTYSTTIRTEQLPQLTQARGAPVQVTTSAGRSTVVEGDFDVEIGPYEFDHPVSSRIEAGNLVVAGAGQAESAFALTQVPYTDVVQADTVATVLLVVGITVLALGAAGFIWLATEAAKL